MYIINRKQKSTDNKGGKMGYKKGSKAKDEEKHGILCEVCGEVKRVSKHWAKYCSVKCKTKAWARRIVNAEDEGKKLKW